MIQLKQDHRFSNASRPFSSSTFCSRRAGWRISSPAQLDKRELAREVESSEDRRIQRELLWLDQTDQFSSSSASSPSCRSVFIIFLSGYHRCPKVVTIDNFIVASLTGWLCLSPTLSLSVAHLSLSTLSSTGPPPCTSSLSSPSPRSPFLPFSFSPSVCLSVSLLLSLF